jgi:hypothetical protein
MEDPHSEEPPTGFPEPPGRDPGDRSHDPDPHHVLNNPVGEPDPTEWPDPYDTREDPLRPADVTEDPPHVPPGTTSTSAPHPDQDPEVEHAKPPQRNRLDD